MPTTVAVRRNFSVVALLDIEDPEFAHYYGLGVYWAMYGDEQGNGPKTDQYLIDNIIRNLCFGRYDRPDAPGLAQLGFYLGMVHGGWLVRPSDTLVILTDPDFAKGYHIGRDYCFTEAPLQDRHLTDRVFTEAVHEWAVEYATWHDSEEVLRYSLGCRIGELSGAIIPLTTAELTFDGVVNSSQIIRLYK
jgi:hypothetical protein